MTPARAPRDEVLMVKPRQTSLVGKRPSSRRNKDDAK